MYSNGNRFLPLAKETLFVDVGEEFVLTYMLVLLTDSVLNQKHKTKGQPGAQKHPAFTRGPGMGRTPWGVM